MTKQRSRPLVARLPLPGEVRECGGRNGLIARRLYFAHCNADEIAVYLGIARLRVSQILRLKAGSDPRIARGLPR